MAEPVSTLPIDRISLAQLEQLGKTFRDRFATYVRDRRTLECQWAKNLRQYLGEYDSSIAIEEGRSRAYPRITRVKCVSMVARLMGLLFPTGENNWSLRASPSPTFDADTLTAALQAWAAESPDAEVTEDSLQMMLREFAQRRASELEREITDQLNDTAAYGAEGYEALVKRVVHSAVLYGMGVLKGPMTLETAESRVRISAEGQPEIVSEQAYRPVFEFVPVWDYYPDMSARYFGQMEGQFHRHVYSQHQLRQLASRGDFFGEAITDYIRRRPEGNYTKQNYESELDTIAAGSLQRTEVVRARNKYEVVEWWGYVNGADLRKVGVEVGDDEVANDVRATLWVLDDVVIKAALDPFEDGVRTYHQFVFEEDEVTLCGSGLPPIMRDSQLAVAAAARMLIDNAATVCGPNLEVDLSLLETGSASTVKSFAVWYKRMDAGASSGRVVQSVSFDSHMTELLAVIDRFMDFADKETFVNPMTGGDFENAPSEPMRTASGTSMILGTTALPFRDIVRNFDQFTVSVIHSLVAWNTVFNQRAGMLGDVRPIGRGATSLIAKEVRAMALDNLATTMRDDEAIHIDTRELARQRVLVRDLPVDTLLVSPQESQRRTEQREQQLAEAAQLQSQLLTAQIKQVNADTFKATAQAQKNLDNGDVVVFKAITEALASGVDPNAVIEFIRRQPTAVVSNQGQPAGPGTAAISAEPV